MRKYLPFILIVLLTTLAFHQTLRMYFWQDDYAFIFRLQHLNEPAGQFGKGFFGQGPYRYIYSWAVPLYQWFKIEPFWYLLYSLVFRLVSLVGVYLFAKELTNRRLGLAAAAVYGSSFIGMETMLRITNTYQTHAGILLATLSFYLLVKFFKSRQLLHYGGALVLFFLAMESAFVRSHGLIVAAAGLFALQSIGNRQWYKNALLFAPFLALFAKIYLVNGSDNPEISEYLTTAWSGQGAINGLRALNIIGNTLVPDVVLDYLISLGTPLLKSAQLVNTLVVALINLPVFALVRLTKQRLALPGQSGLSVVIATIVFSITVISLALKTTLIKDLVPAQTVVGFAALVTIGWLIAVLWRTKRQTAIALAAGIIWLVANLLVYHLRAPSNLFESTDRYLTYSTVGLGLLVASLTGLYASTEQLFWQLIGLVIVINLGLNINYQYRFVHRLSLPARRFYRELKSQLPVINKGSVVLFDVKKDPELGFQFRNFFHVASMPESTAIAVHYGIDRYDFTLVDSFDELLKQFDQATGPIDKIQTFYYNGELTNTSGQVRAALAGQGKETIIAQDKQYQAGPDNPLVIDQLKFDSSSPVELILEAQADIGPPVNQRLEAELPAQDQRAQTFEYLKAAYQYRLTTTVSASSSWQHNQPKHLTDNNPATFWIADRGLWAEKQTESIILDLGAIKSINRTLFVNAHPTRTPTRYQLLVSTDGTNYQSVKTTILTEGLEAEAIQLDQFEPTAARFVKMAITASSGGDAPSLAEFEVIEDRFSSVDVSKARNLERTPFADGDEANAEAARSFLKNGGGQLEIKIKTNRSTNFEEQFGLIRPILDNKLHRYSVILKPGGTQLESVMIKPLNFPAALKIKQIIIRQPSLEQLKQTNFD